MADSLVTDGGPIALATNVDSSRQLAVYQQVAESLERRLKSNLLALLAHIGHLNKAVKVGNQYSFDPLVDLQIDGIITQQLLLLQQSIGKSIDKAFLAFESESIRLVQSNLNTEEEEISRKVYSESTKELKAMFAKVDKAYDMPVTYDSVDRLLLQLPSKVCHNQTSSLLD